MENNTLRQIRASYTDTTIRVYQAYSHAIADAALGHSKPLCRRLLKWSV